MRVGFGYDLHLFDKDRKLILGGAHIPGSPGLAGHSDADVVCHAVMDALLGAAALGDIGAFFPDTDDAFKDASSIRLLEQAASMVRGRGYSIVNIDITVIAQEPKLAPYRDLMRRNIAAAAGISIDAVSVKATTNEGADATGRGEAVAVHAVTLIRGRQQSPDMNGEEVS